MVLTLPAFSIITTLGFAIWILGYLFDFTGIAVIGGAIVIASGAMVVENGGLDQKVGEVEVTNSTTNETTTSFQYDKYQTPTQFNLGSITTLVGGVLVIHKLREDSGV